jgi:hypothetical protein
MAEKNKNEGNLLPKTEEITFKGSLGILALGAVGIEIWKKKRVEEKLKINSNKKDG